MHEPDGHGEQREGARWQEGNKRVKFPTQAPKRTDTGKVPWCEAAMSVGTKYRSVAIPKLTWNEMAQERSIESKLIPGKVLKVQTWAQATARSVLTASRAREGSGTGRAAAHRPTMLLNVVIPCAIPREINAGRRNFQAIQ